MKITAEKITDINLAHEAMAFTSGKTASDMKSSLCRIYELGHSVIRTQLFVIRMYEIPSFVSVHFVRHKIGVEHFVSSRRDGLSSERTDLVNHMMLCNAESLMNMARRRLCLKAHAETRKVMRNIKTAVASIDRELSENMMTNCKYRGGICHERCENVSTILPQ